jgi:hypothetical protein
MFASVRQNGFIAGGIVSSPASFKGASKMRTKMCNCTSENLEIPGLVLAHHPGMTRGVNGRRLADALPGLAAAEHSAEGATLDL